MFFEVLNPLNIVIQQSVLCFVASLLILTGVGIIQCKYSGIPYISENAQIIMKKVLVVVFVWSLGRIIHGILYLIREKDLINKNSDLSGIDVNNTYPTIILMLDLVVTELICFIFVVDYSFFQTFLKEIDDFPKLSLLEPLTPVEFSQKKLDLSAQEENIHIEYELSSIEHKLGTLYKGTYLSQEVAIRRICIQRINHYIIERLEEDLISLSKILCPHFLMPIALSIRNNIIDIIYPFIPTGSLNLAIHSHYTKFTYMQKLKIAREIAFCIKAIHDFGKIHGHLTSHNILLDSNCTISINDLGLDHLKKYCAVTTGYCNKSA